MQRRTFLRRAFQGSLFLAAATPGQLAALSSDRRLIQLTVLHTNDWHSQIDPMRPSSRAGETEPLGGAARRAALISKIRAEQERVLLLDCGDIWQGTPYFNVFGGELEYKLMSQMGYDAATIGNHDFDAGLDGLLKQLPNASFPFVSSNYDFSQTIIAGKTLPHLILERAPLKIGIFGLGPKLEGLVPKTGYLETQWQDPIARAQEVSTMLKTEQKCDLVICLSHLGYEMAPWEPDDLKLAAQTEHLDLILGGHTHTYLQRPVSVANAAGRPVLISQMGYGAKYLGRLDLFFSPSKERICVDCNNLRLDGQI
ncbi:MAG: metallophosphatase [Bacteroidota bacterium]